MFDTILVPVDPAEPEFSKQAINTAARLAKDYGSRLRLVAVLINVQGFVSSYLPDDFEQKATEDTLETLRKMSKNVDLPEGKISYSVRVGSVYHQVIEDAEYCHADLVVMSSHPPALSTYIIGSNAANIVRHAPCSVMVLRPEQAQA